MITFKFHKERAAEACASFIKLGVTDLHTLLIYIYLADRKCFIGSGDNITGANYKFLFQLPQSDHLNEMVKDEDIFYLDDGKVSIIRDPGDGNLSDFIDLIINSIVSEYSKYDYNELLNVVAKLPEWKSSGMMEPDRILKAIYFSQDEIDQIKERIDYHNWFYSKHPRR